MVGERGTSERRLGQSFVLSYLDAPTDVLQHTLHRLMTLAEKWDTPLLIALDGQNWWGGSPHLWNWFDKSRPGYNPANRENVEWFDHTPDAALKIAWRNWGRQIRVLPPPNLASPRFRAASRLPLSFLTRTLHTWGKSLPAEKRYLYPGIKVGWEASLGVNAFYYPGGNEIWEKNPTDDSNDPKTGLKKEKDFSGGLVPVGYAALASKGWSHPGPITLQDHERITSDYLKFLVQTCHAAGLPREEIYTHSGGQFAPWQLHYSHQVAVQEGAIPGWSFYGTAPRDAGDLAETLTRTGSDDWCAAEWLPFSRTAAEWTKAWNDVLLFRNCHFVALYNWEGIRENPEALEGLRQALRYKG